MTNIYIRLPQVRFCSTEEIIEQAKGSLRFRFNINQEIKLRVIGSSKIKSFAEKIIRPMQGIKIIDSSEVRIIDRGRIFIKIMSYSELEDIFRQEAEYWVIRNKLPVYLYFINGFICFYLLKEKRRDSFPDFRVAERYISEKFNEVDRVRIAESPFAEENNLVALFKIK